MEIEWRRAMSALVRHRRALVRRLRCCHRCCRHHWAALVAAALASTVICCLVPCTQHDRLSPRASVQLAVLLALLGCLVQDGSGGGSSAPPAWQVAAEQQPPADLNLTQLRWVPAHLDVTDAAAVYILLLSKTSAAAAQQRRHAVPAWPAPTPLACAASPAPHPPPPLQGGVAGNVPLRLRAVHAASLPKG